MAGLKHSRQRDAIAENLRHRKDHPTADMIYKDIRNVYPNYLQVLRECTRYE